MQRWLTCCDGWTPDSGYAFVGETLLAVPNVWTVKPPFACGLNFGGWAPFSAALMCFER